ncbi:ArnT family glycosyltransferase [Bifidobacterium aquikefiri]|uniref:ArnT family glycosyltransferase n=1 Tax=Bifidobacterium aquikefiri TaxID=1653207 RepID=UPI0039EC3762
MNFKTATKDSITWVSRHAIASVSILFIFLSTVVCLIQLASINTYYVVTLSDAAQAGETVTFAFDANPGYTESAVQGADIIFKPQAEAKLRVDPVNLDSKSLRISIPGDNVTMEKFSSVISVNGTVLYQNAAIDGSDISHSAEGSQRTYQLTEAQLSSIHSQAGLKSEVKLMLLAVLIFIYIAAIMRLTVLRGMKRLHFIVTMLVSVLTLGFIANALLVKQPIEIQQSVTSSSPTSIQQSAAFSATQSFDPVDDVSHITLPVSITGDVDPNDSTNANYSSVYENNQEFHDSYKITVVQGSSHTMLFKGRVTPSMLDSELSSITISLHASPRDGPLEITLSKNEEPTVPTLQFQTYPSVTNASYTRPASVQGLQYGSSVYLAVNASYQGFDYRTLIALLVLGFCVLLILNLWCSRRARLRLSRALPVTDYLVLLVYAIMQLPIYAKYVQGFPDELAHISYVAYLQKHGGLIPDFKNMVVYALGDSPHTFDLSHSQSFNYLGHPPLYYQIMKLLGGVTVNGNVASYNLSLMRMESFGIGLLGIALLFYISLTRLPKIPLLHLLFGLLIISPPNLIYGMSGVNNDSLTILSVSICLLGLVRFYEKRFGCMTYLLIAVGITTSLLTKLTAGMIVSIAAICILAYSIVVERQWRNLWSWRFLVSLPIYLPIPAYFATMYMKYHALQPSFAKLAYHEYVHSIWYTPLGQRSEMGVWGFITTYLSNFMNTWFNLAGATTTGRDAAWPFFSLDRIGIVLVLLIPFALFFITIKSTAKIYLQFGMIAVGIAMLMQMKGTYASVMMNGRFGGYSSRYYLCAIGLFALAIMLLICKYLVTRESHDPSQLQQGNGARLDDSTRAGTEITQRLTSSGMMLCSLFCMLLFFDGFIYSVLYQATSITGFTLG